MILINLLDWPIDYIWIWINEITKAEGGMSELLGDSKRQYIYIMLWEKVKVAIYKVIKFTEIKV